MGAGIDVARLDQDKVVRIDLGSQETKRNMRTISAEWAQRGPVYVPRDGHVIVICSRHADAMEAYQDVSRLSNAVPREPGFEMFDKFMGVRVLAQMDGEAHLRVRRLMTPALGPRAIARLEEGVGASLDRLLDKIEARGRSFDVMHDYGEYLIVEGMLTNMLNLTDAQKQVFLEMHRVIPLVTYTEAGNKYPEECVAAFANARKLINDMVAERRAKPGDDLISDLIAARDEGDKLSDEEMFDQIFTLTAGALSGTTGAAGGAFYALYKHPESISVLRDDPSLIPQAFAEAQRWHSGSYMTFPRFVTTDSAIGGTPIQKGMVVRVNNQGAHMDATVYPDPLKFDVHRNPKNISFGSGPHLCLGHHFAKLVMRVAIERLIARFPDARLADPDMQVTYGGSVGELRISALPMVTH